MNKKIADFVISGRRRSHFIQWRVWFRGGQIRQMPEPAGSGQHPPELIFYFLAYYVLLSLPPPKNLTKQKFYSKIKQKRKEVKFLHNKKKQNPQPRPYFPGKIKKVTL